MEVCFGQYTADNDNIYIQLFGQYKAETYRHRLDIHMYSTRKCNAWLLLGAYHLISRGGRVFTSKLLFISLPSATKKIHNFRASHNHFIFFLHFVHISIGQIVDNIFFTENHFFLFFSKADFQDAFDNYFIYL